jgi:hypothetical protein
MSPMTADTSKLLEEALKLPVEPGRISRFTDREP